MATVLKMFKEHMELSQEDICNRLVEAYVCEESYWGGNRASASRWCTGKANVPGKYLEYYRAHGYRRLVNDIKTNIIPVLDHPSQLVEEIMDVIQNDNCIKSTVKEELFSEKEAAPFLARVILLAMKKAERKKKKHVTANVMVPAVREDTSVIVQEPMSKEEKMKFFYWMYMLQRNLADQMKKNGKDTINIRISLKDDTA